MRIRDIRVPVAMLSGGQRQSVAIARALIGEPRVVILDEPTAALGVEQTAQVLDLIRRLRDRGLAVLVISHNLADVRAVSDRIVVLRLGRNAGEFGTADATPEADRGRDHRGLAGDDARWLREPLRRSRCRAGWAAAATSARGRSSAG